MKTLWLFEYNMMTRNFACINMVVNLNIFINLVLMSPPVLDYSSCFLGNNLRCSLCSIVRHCLTLGLPLNHYVLAYILFNKVILKFK